MYLSKNACFINDQNQSENFIVIPTIFVQTLATIYRKMDKKNTQKRPKEIS